MIMKDQLLVSAQHDRVRKGFVPGVTFLLKKPPSPWEGGIWAFWSKERPFSNFVNALTFHFHNTVCFNPMTEMLPTKKYAFPKQNKSVFQMIRHGTVPLDTYTGNELQ